MISFQKEQNKQVTENQKLALQTKHASNGSSMQIMAKIRVMLIFTEQLNTLEQDVTLK